MSEVERKHIFFYVQRVYIEVGRRERKNANNVSQ